MIPRSLGSNPRMSPSPPTLASARSVLLAMALVLGLGACDESEASLEPMVTDSAGVAVVEHSVDPASLDPGDAAVPRSLADEPAVEIGRADGAEGPDLFGQVTDVTLLESGALAVADGQAREIRVFDANGEHLRTMGGEGEGPGEFGALLWVEGLPGDSIVAFDQAGLRVSNFDDEGTLEDSFRLEPDGIAAWVRDLLGDRWLVVDERMPPQEGSADHQDVRIQAVPVDGGEPREVGVFAGPELTDNMAPPVLAASSHFAAGDSLLWHSNSRDLELVAYDAEGERRRVIRVDREREPISDEEAQEIMDRVRENPEGGAPMADVMEGIGFADHYPAHGSVLVDESGLVWVQRYRLPTPLGGPLDEEYEESWDIFNLDGSLVGTLTLPQGFRTARAGAEWVLGVHTDALGVQRVQLYPLERE